MKHISNTSQGSLRDICGIYLRSGLITELFRRIPRKIKFSGFPALELEPSALADNPRSKAFRRLAKLSKNQRDTLSRNDYYQAIRSKGFGGIALYIRFPLLDFLSLILGFYLGFFFITNILLIISNACLARFITILFLLEIVSSITFLTNSLGFFLDNYFLNNSSSIFRVAIITNRAKKNSALNIFLNFSLVIELQFISLKIISLDRFRFLLS